MTVLFRFFTQINLGLAIFNLIPVPPLDGSKIIGYFTSYKIDRKIEQYSMYIFFGFVLLVFSGLLDGPLGAVNNALFWVIDKITFWVDPLMKSIFGL
jgi:Zn-dependent protease